MRAPQSDFTASGSSLAAQQRVTVAWAAYFALAPVAWLPGVDVPLVFLLKSLVFVGAMFFSVVLVKRLRLPNGVLGPIGLAVISMSSGAAMLQAVSTSVAFRRLAEILLAFAIVWVFWALAGIGYRLDTAPLFAFFVHAALGAVVVASFIGVPLPSVNSPVTGNALAPTAFAVGRTAWANSVALFFPFAAYHFVVGTVSRWWIAIAFGASIGGVLVSGGRAGLLAGLLAIALVVSVLRPKTIPIVVAAAMIVASVTASWWLRENEAPSLIANRLDAISSGRVTIYETAWSRWLERPFTGFGYGQVVVDIGSGEPRAIHNLYLRLAVDGGIGLLAGFLVLTARLALNAVRYLRSYTRERESMPGIGVAYVGVLAAGAIVAMFEGDVLLGAMHVAVVWWACAGLISRSGQLAHTPASHELASIRAQDAVAGD